MRPPGREFVDRIRGLSYQEIAARGGGILNSARALRDMSEDALFDVSLERMERLMRMGTGAMEIKSGYGLDLESELKMLRVARRLGALDRIPVKTTFLGCHAVPEGWSDAMAYTRHMVEEVLPAVTEENLADHVDIFCEDGYFGLEETRLLLEQARLRGLLAKVHVNQFTAGGGVALCVEMGALSVDHLEVLEDQDVAELASSETMPVSLPLCSLFLDLPYTPGRTLVDAGWASRQTSIRSIGQPIWRRLWAVSGWGRADRSPRGGVDNGAAALGLSDKVGGLAGWAGGQPHGHAPTAFGGRGALCLWGPLADRVLARGHWVS